MRTAGAAVRDALLQHGFTVDSVLGALGPDAFAALGRGEVVPAKHVLAEVADGPLTDLIRMFLIGEVVPAERAGRALPLADAVGLDLVGWTEEGAGTTVTAGSVRARIHLQPYPTPDGDAFVASDFPAGLTAPRSRGLKPDHVIGVGGASVTLATITPRQPVAQTLDLGTGCGVQALLAAGHSNRVVATDRSERALRMAALTAALSSTDFDLRAGSLFDPVADQSFDLIVANPPFVISPHARYTYRESPLRADDLSRSVVADAASHLTPGGVAVVLANWLHTAEESWHDRLARWAPAGCQVWVAQRERLTAPEYAELWLRDSADHDGADYESMYSEWLTYLDDLSATGVGFGWIVIRRSGPGWFVAEDVSDAERLPDGSDVLSQLDHFTQLQEANAVSLLRSSPRWAGRVELHRSWRPGGPDGEHLATGSWRPAETVDPVVEEILARSGTLTERITDLAPDDEDAADELTGRALLGLRRLIGSGLVALDA